MKHLIIALLAVAASLPLLGRPDWSGNRSGLGDQSVDGGLRLDLPITRLPGSGEFALPLTLRHRVVDTAKGPSSDWFVPQLFTYVVPEGKKGFRWIEPGGTERSFTRKEVLASVPDRFSSDWVCVNRAGHQVEFHSRDGWVYSYESGLLQNLRAPSGRQLRFETEGPRITAIVLQGDGLTQKILAAEWTDGGKIESLAVGPGEHRFLYSETRHPLLTEWQANSRPAAPVQFTYNKEGLLESLDRYGPGTLAFQWMVPGEGWISRHQHNLPAFASPALLARVNKTEYGYDTNRRGVILTRRQADGSESHLTVDFRANESTLLRPDGSKLTHRYFSQASGPASGKLASIESASGRTLLEATYNDFGDLLGTRRPGGATTVFTYDDLGRVTARQELGKEPWRWQYEGNSRLPATVVDPLGGTVAFERDRSNNLVGMTDLRGGEHRFRYDAFGRMVVHEFPTGHERELTYDDWGRVT